MSRYIDADAVYELFESFKDAFDNVDVCSAYSQTLSAVDDVPAVDVVEVVRCKDCKHYHVETHLLYGDYETFKWCDLLYIRGKIPTDPKPMNFCSYGERR